MRPFLKQLRTTSTDAERLLWARLRAGRLLGFKFRRQYEMGRYVLDFYCPSRRLCVEVDGGQHAVRMESDARRTAFLESRRIRVIRFWNNDVLARTDVVVEEIFNELNKRETTPSERFTSEEGPSPRPSP